jgi:hypothetical protein
MRVIAGLKIAEPIAKYDGFAERSLTFLARVAKARIAT